MDVAKGGMKRNCRWFKSNFFRITLFQSFTIVKTKTPDMHQIMLHMQSNQDQSTSGDRSCGGIISAYFCGIQY